MRPVGLLGPQSALLFGGICWSRNEGLSTEHQQPWGRGGEPLGAGRNPSKGTGGGGGAAEGGEPNLPSTHNISAEELRAPER